MVMEGPEGERNETDGTILAWDDGRRIVSTDAILVGDDGAVRPGTPFMIGTWEIAPEGDGTRYIASAAHWSEEDRDRHRDMGFEQGWMACADQLAALCEKN